MEPAERIRILNERIATEYTISAAEAERRIIHQVESNTLGARAFAHALRLLTGLALRRRSIRSPK